MHSPMHILSVETSCDETAIAIVDIDNNRFTVRSSVISSQIALHEQYGGVVPALAAREHAANIEHVFLTALKEAGVTDPERAIDLIAVTRGPGLGPALLVGLTFARTLAWRWNKPIIGVNHMDGHIFRTGSRGKLLCSQRSTSLYRVGTPTLYICATAMHATS